MEKIKQYIYEQVAAQNLSKERAKALLLEVQQGLSNRLEDDIAVIGMAGRFPGAKNLDEFWNNLLNGVNCIGNFPLSRRNDTDYFLEERDVAELIAGVPLPEVENLDDLYVMGGYLHDVDKFDAGFFRISPREAKMMDPLQRVFLEIAWEAIDDAGYGNEERIYGTKTGVFVGKDHTAESVYKKLIKTPDPLVLTGSWTGILASRISYIFNLRGPSLVIDTACSSGLVSLHKACQALKDKECEMAIAGGINLAFIPLDNKKMEMVESDDSMVRTFDRRANGTVWGEGAGALLLKPLSHALADGDHIHAIIKGSAINNDGASNGITAPNAEAQEEVILEAWKEARINPETVAYVEAHGTGTVLGDPIEVKGLTNAFRAHTQKKQFCGIGSVKTSIGHLVAASGLASTIKVILALKNRLLPASINFDEPNPYISFTETPLYVNDRLREWPRTDAPRRAGVNSFGFSGTNCHVVLEEAPEREQPVRASKAGELMTISARSKEALFEYVRQYHRFLQHETNLNLADLCYTASTGRNHFAHRLALVVESLEQLQMLIDQLLKNGLEEHQLPEVYYSEHKIVTSNRKTRAGEITEGERQQLTRSAGEIISHLHPTQAGNYGSAERELADLTELARVYVAGAELAWERFYQGGTYYRISIPAYPMEQIRYWVDQVPMMANSAKEAVKTIEHPLLDRCLADSMFEEIYSTNFSVKKHWVLTDHKVMGNYVVPGTTYLEIAREACRKHYPDGVLTLRDIFFLTPLMVAEEEVKEVQTILKKEKDHIAFVIASRVTSEDPDAEERWVKHVEGQVWPPTADVRPGYDLAELSGRLGQWQATGTTNTGAFEFGPRWRNLQRAARGEDEGLVELEMPLELREPVYLIHPALLDNAVNVASQSFGEGLYLPLSYRAAKVFAPMPGKFYSYLRKKNKDSDNLETVSFDVSLIDESGQVFMEIEDYTIKRVHEAELKFTQLSGKANAYYELAWVEQEIEQERATQEGGTALILKGATQFADELAARLEAAGHHVLTVDITAREMTASAYDTLLASLQEAGIAQIFHCAAIRGGSEPRTFAELVQAEEQGVYSLYHLTRALLNNKFKDHLEIYLIADQVHAVTGAETYLNPEPASLFGLAKVVGIEYPNLRCRSIDLDAASGVDAVLHELRCADNLLQVAYRQGKRYVEEFRKTEPGKVEPAFTVRADGAYLITGGTGGLGLEVAKYLATQGKVNLALVNRSAIPPRAAWEGVCAAEPAGKLAKKLRSLQELETLGATVRTYAADIADPVGVRQMLAEVRADFGQINGVFHCAGLAGDGFILNKATEVFMSVVAPKTRGTWLLDRLTASDALDHFVMFSSITALTGGPGQGDYTAANSYLDAYAAYRQRTGRRTLTINWPAWKETGMAVDYGVNDELSLFKSVTTAKALEMFEQMLNSPKVQLLPASLNYKAILAIPGGLPIRLSAQLKTAIEKQRQRGPAGTGQAQERKVVEVTILGRDESEYTLTERQLAQCWANVLDVSEIDIYESFYDMGGDSILATQLLKELERVFPGMLDISDIFSYPSIVQCAEYLDKKLGAAAKVAEAPLEMIAESPEADMNDEELKRLLDDLASGEASVASGLEFLNQLNSGDDDE